MKTAMRLFWMVLLVLAGYWVGKHTVQYLY
jgi:hypothetical protein